ncbi:hypothetical protein [Streptomyces sp. L2]|uniref:hypothetical protein n=1 Tax=Streptomyces sp. L2 TaxID=2162665 RepID=UPI0010105526|nr:hypothetical protein [Streptomyces sp. L2]
MRTLVNALVLVSVAAALALAPRLAAARPPDADGPEDSPRRTLTPLPPLAVVTALIYVNQVLFTVYVLRVHDGDPSFIARYLPGGWFELATRDPVLRSLARDFPAPWTLAPTVLRVQAFLELPFVLLAFTTVVRWLDAGLYRRLARSPLLPLASASYTAVFCLVEWDLRNPYTVDDLAVRTVSAVLTPLFLARLAARDRGRGRTPASVPGLLTFLVSLGALGVLVLVVYDTALLYSLGRLGERLPLALGAGTVLAAARLIAVRLAEPRPRLAVGFLHLALRHWLTLFLLPALAVRYGVLFGTPLLAAVAGIVPATAAGAYAVRDTLKAPAGHRRGPLLRTLAARLACAALAGTAAAYAVVRLTPATYYEATLLPAAAAFLSVTVATCGALDGILDGVLGTRTRERPKGRTSPAG